MGRLFAFSFSDYVGAQNLEPSNHGNLERGFIVATGVPARDIHALMYAPSLMTISRSVQTREISGSSFFFTCHITSYVIS